MCILVLSSAQCALEIVSELNAGSVPAESMGKHEVGGTGWDGWGHAREQDN